MIPLFGIPLLIFFTLMGVGCGRPPTVDLNIGKMHICLDQLNKKECFYSKSVDKNINLTLQLNKIVSNENVVCEYEKNNLACIDMTTGKARAVPVSGAKLIDLNSRFSCAIDRKLHCWDEKLNLLNVKNSPLLTRPEKLAVGNGFGIVLDSEGLKFFGEFPEQKNKVREPDLSYVREVDAGLGHICALDKNSVKCWGENEKGQSTVPLDLEFPYMISAGDTHSCSVDMNGIQCWGNLSFKMNLKWIVAISSYKNRTCVLTMSDIGCWGEYSNEFRDMIFEVRTKWKKEWLERHLNWWSQRLNGTDQVLVNSFVESVKKLDIDHKAYYFSLLEHALKSNLMNEDMKCPKESCGSSVNVSETEKIQIDIQILELVHSYMEENGLVDFNIDEIKNIKSKSIDCKCIFESDKELLKNILLKLQKSVQNSNKVGILLPILKKLEVAFNNTHSSN